MPPISWNLDRITCRQTSRQRKPSSTQVMCKNRAAQEGRTVCATASQEKVKGSQAMPQKEVFPDQVPLYAHSGPFWSQCFLDFDLMYYKLWTYSKFQHLPIKAIFLTSILHNLLYYNKRIKMVTSGHQARLTSDHWMWIKTFLPWLFLSFWNFQ